MGHGGLFGKQVVSDTRMQRLDVPCKIGRNPFDKRCRIARVCGNILKGVF